MSTPTAPNLGSIITSPALRKTVYAVVGAYAFIIGGVAAVYLAVPGWGYPEWLTAAMTVAGYLTIGTSGLALANTPKTPTPPSSDGSYNISSLPESDPTPTHSDYTPAHAAPVDATPAATPKDAPSV